MTQEASQQDPPKLDQNDQLWLGIISQRGWQISDALAKGADVLAGPSEHIRKQYPERKLQAGTLPVVGLFQQSDRLRSGLDHRHMEYKDACKTLIKATKKVHFGQRGGTTPLIEYTRIDKSAQRHAIFMQVLRRTPPDALDQRDTHGWSALDYALKSGLLQSVKALIAAGVDPDARNERGENALLAMAKFQPEGRPTQERLALRSTLLKHGARVHNTQSGTTYLHLDTSLPLAHLDLDGFDINALDAEGQSLAMRAINHHAWHRLEELLHHPETDLARQLPDMAAIEKKRKQVSTMDHAGQRVLGQLDSYYQEQQLRHAAPPANAPRSRFRL